MKSGATRVLITLAMVVAVFVFVRIIAQNIPVPVSSVQTWSGGGQALVPSVPTVPVNTAPSVVADGHDVPLIVVATSTSTSAPIPASDTSATDWLASLTGSVRSTTSTTNTLTAPSSFSDIFAYSLIPGGVATTTQQVTKTPEEQALYVYGNALGAKILGFEEAHPDMPSTLQSQAADPANVSKQAAVVALADDYAALGKDVSMLEAPTSIAPVVHKLSVSYAGMADKLRAVPSAVAEKERVSSMLAYDTAADEYIRSFLGVVSTFSAYGIKFDKSEPGSVFMLSAPSL